MFVGMTDFPYIPNWTVDETGDSRTKIGTEYRNELARNEKYGALSILSDNAVI